MVSRQLQEMEKMKKSDEVLKETKGFGFLLLPGFVWFPELLNSSASLSEEGIILSTWDQKLKCLQGWRSTRAKDNQGFQFCDSVWISRVYALKTKIAEILSYFSSENQNPIHLRWLWQIPEAEAPRTAGWVAQAAWTPPSLNQALKTLVTKIMKNKNGTKKIQDCWL